MKKTILLAAICIIGIPPAFANEVTVTFESGGSGPGGIYPPYSAEISTGATPLPITLYCVDYPDHVYDGETWTANITPVDSSNLSNTYFSGLGADIYQELAYLTNVVQTDALAVQTDIAKKVDSSGDQANLEAAQNAIWQLTDAGDFSVPGYVLNGSDQYVPSPAVENELNLAVENASPQGSEDWYVLSGTNAGSGRVQEFLFDTNNINGYEAPEPSTFWLAGGLMALMATIGLRRRKRLTA